MAEQLKAWGLLAGRVLLGQIFLLSGVMKVLNWSQTAEHMTSEGMTAVPFFLFMAIVFEIGGGLSLLLGCKARWGALALVLFLVPVTLIFHDFWAYEGQAMQNQMAHFLKNVTILGGLLTLAAAGAGRFSLDALFHRAATTDARAREAMAEALVPYQPAIRGADHVRGQAPR